MASTGWFIGMMLALALLLLVLVLVCIIKRNRGGKYAVHEREATHGRKDFNEDAGFHEYSQPYVVYRTYKFNRRISLVLTLPFDMCIYLELVAAGRPAKPL